MSKFNQEQLKEIELLYKNGTSLKEIARQFNCAPSTVSSWLKKVNVKPVGHNQTKWVNETYFDTIETEEQAYLLGFFIADGCIRIEKDSRNENWNPSIRFAFSNSIDDEEIIKIIHNRICPNNKMLYRHNTSGAIKRKPQVSIQWTSYKMYDTMVSKYKIMPEKTCDCDFEFPFETIPKELWRHFIRGFMDGDGSINKSELRFVFNSPKFMNQFLEIFKELFLEHEETVWEFSYTSTCCKGKTCNYWRLFIPLGHGRGKLIKSFLYKDSTIFLSRKFNRAFKNVK